MTRRDQSRAGTSFQGRHFVALVALFIAIAGWSCKKDVGAAGDRDAGTDADGGGTDADTGTDIISPAAIIDLVVSSCTSSSCDLTWTAPGDDGNQGVAASYDVRYSIAPITESNWDSATEVSGEPPPQPAGSVEALTVSGLSPETTYYFAVKTSDEVPNVGAMSNVASGTTLSQPQYDCSSPHPDWIICEDWDLDDPGDFPFTPGSNYHDAHAGNYGHPENNRISSDVAHSGSRSLKLEKVTTSSSGGDVEFSIADHDEIYIRWYYHFPTGWAEGFDSCSGGHLVFINTAYHGYLKLDPSNNYAVGMDLPNLDIGSFTDAGGNIWSALCDPGGHSVRSVWFDGTMGVHRNSYQDISGPGEWYHDDTGNILYVYSTSNPSTAYTNPGVQAADSVRRFFNHGETLGCPRRLNIALGGVAAENESSCWTCSNSRGAGQHTSGDSTRPLYYKDEDTDNTYWSIYDHEDEWVCFEWYIDNVNHITRLWINGAQWLETDPTMFTWGEDGNFDNGLNKVIFSNYRHDETFPNTLYIDDVVISTSYIGPLQ